MNLKILLIYIIGVVAYFLNSGSPVRVYRICFLSLLFIKYSGVMVLLFLSILFFLLFVSNNSNIS